jgi:hypothetical protein
VQLFDADKAMFSWMDDFGVPMTSLKEIIEMKAPDRSKAGNRYSFDSTDNQLKDWIYNARIANIEVNDRNCKIAIKGDAKNISSNQKGNGYLSRSENQ